MTPTYPRSVTSTETRPRFDFLDGRFYAGELGDPRAAYAWMRANEPVCRDERNGCAGIATYDALMAAERDAELFSNAGGSDRRHRRCRT